ncbi:MAG: hypothetical protein DCC49_01140 [Acidobacteria bacterium]|nr:MAG: hypothetical protein DCC49_01140 [Acidobacteriota bacterium]
MRIFVRLEARAPEHPKVVGISSLAWSWWTKALCYCKRQELDGLVPHAVVALLLPDLHRYEIDGNSVSADDLVDELIEAGLAKHSEAKDVLLHDWIDYQTSAAQLASLRYSRKEAGRKGGIASGKARRKQTTKHLLHDQKASGKSAQSRRQDAADRLEADFNEVWATYPRKTGRLAALKAYKARRREKIPAEDLAIATANYAKLRSGEDPQFTKHGATFFGPSAPWRDYLPGGAGLIEANQSRIADNDHVSEASQAWRAYKRFIADQSVYECCDFPDDRMKFAAYETYGNWREMCECAGRERNEDKAVFIKAWNEFEDADA